MLLTRPGTRVLTVDDQPLDGPAVLRFLESVARTCYKSEEKITTDSAVAFVQRLRDNGHEAMLEFFDVVVRFVLPRGVSHELVRHRLASYAQESTRFCDYQKTGHVAFIIPPRMPLLPGVYTRHEDPRTREWHVQFDGRPLDQPLNPTQQRWLAHMFYSEESYQIGRAGGWRPEEARGMLPIDLKTEIVMKANLREWRHVFRLRTMEKAHPQMRLVMRPLLQYFQQVIPVLFDDIGWETPDYPIRRTCPTLRKVGDMEPIFVLRAQDRLAPEVVRHWANLLEQAGGPPEKVAGARKIAEAMQVWNGPHKLPD